MAVLVISVLLSGRPSVQKIVITQSASGETRVFSQIVKRAVRVRAHGMTGLNPAPDARFFQPPTYPVLLDKSHELQDAPGNLPGFGGLPGRTFFSRLGKRTLYEFGAVAEQRHGKNIVFLTGTQPGSGDAVTEAFARYSSYLVQRLTQWTRDNVQSPLVAWVFERQKRGALHWHCVVAAERPEELDFIRDSWRQQWISILEQISGLAGVNLFYNPERGEDMKGSTQADARRCDQGVARYLSKYMGKTCGKDEQEGKRYVYPCRWWRVSNEALQAIKSARERVEIDCHEAHSVAALISKATDVLSTRAQAFFKVLVPARSVVPVLVAYPHQGDAKQLLSELLNMALILLMRETVQILC